MYWGLSRDSENGMKAELGPMSVQGEAVGSKTRKGENKATAVKAVPYFLTLSVCWIMHL